MIVDNEWPADFAGEHAEGSPRYEDLVTYCDQWGFGVSKSAIGRWAVQLRTMARFRQAGLITRQIMSDLTNEKASQTQKAVAEMITAVAIEFIGGHDNFDADQIRDVAKAMKDCTAIAINSDKYVREQLALKVKAACESTEKKLAAAGVDRKKIQEIIDDHLGVVKS